MSGIDNHTVLMLHMNDSTFKDECGNEVTNNGVTLDTTNKKFGSGSVYCYRTSNYYLKYSDSENFKFTGDFTIDGYFYMTSVLGTKTLFSNRSSNTSSTGFAIATQNNSQYLNFYSNGYKKDSTNPISLNIWTHIAVVRYLSIITYYINGISCGSFTDNTNYSDGRCYVGGINSPSSQSFAGNIDEFRISNIARWTSNFTPPTHEYTSENFLIKDNNEYKYTSDGNTLNTILNEDTLSNNFDNYGMSDLTNINSNIIQGIQNEKYNICNKK